MRSMQEAFADVDARLRFDERVHRYWLDNKPIPGVTTILNHWDRPQLDAWKVRVQQDADIAVAWKLATRSLGLPEDFAAFAQAFKDAAGEEYEHAKQSREAADLGLQLHALIEEHLKRKLGIPFEIARPITDEAQGLFSSWLEWEESDELEPLYVERRIYHEGHYYAGTIDLLANTRYGLSVLDWKTKVGTGTPWPDQMLQNIAYRRAVADMLGTEVTGHIVVVPKDGGRVIAHQIEPGPKDKWTTDDLFTWFLACRALYEAGRMLK